jgi:hypothetical protein
MRRFVRSRHTVLFASLAGASAIVGVMAGLSTAHDFSAAAPGEASYVISDAKATYSPESSQASATFTYHWSTSTYPGKADCKVDYLDDQGNVVGSTVVSLTSLTPSAQMTSDFAQTKVSGTPSSVAGTCAAGDADQNSGTYAFSEVEINSKDVNLATEGNEVALDFTANWTSSAPPGEQQCVLNATASDKSPLTYSFTLGSGDGDHSELLLPGAYADSTDPVISCSPITQGVVSK